MTFVEYAENVLGIELLDWQKVVLEKVQECKDDGKSFYINIYSSQGKTLLYNFMQQKLGFDRGVEYGSNTVIRNVLTSLKEIQRGFGTLEEYIDQLEASVNDVKKDSAECKKGGEK